MQCNALSGSSELDSPSAVMPIPLPILLPILLFTLLPKLLLILPHILLLPTLLPILLLILLVDLLQVMDAYLRDRAKENGAKIYNGLYLRSTQEGTDGPFTLTFSNYDEGGKVTSQYITLVQLSLLLPRGQRCLCLVHHDSSSLLKRNNS
jgi:hypothetical protein